MAKLNKDFSAAEILKDIPKQIETVKKVSGDAPENPEERVAAQELLLKAAAGEISMMVICIGCQKPIEFKNSQLCECGEFVCAPCVEEEEKDVCNHDLEDLLLSMPLDIDEE